MLYETEIFRFVNYSLYFSYRIHTSSFIQYAFPWISEKHADIDSLFIFYMISLILVSILNNNSNRGLHQGYTPDNSPKNTYNTINLINVGPAKVVVSVHCQNYMYIDYLNNYISELILFSRKDKLPILTPYFQMAKQ